MKTTQNERVTSAVERLGEAIERATLSRQPRFAAGDRQEFFGSVLKWLRRAEMEEPPYQADSRPRDAWLRDFWRREPHLAGVLHSVVAIDQNRHWTLTGGRNQVRRYTEILQQAENGAGWRHYAGLQALSYYTADIGAITEIGREGRYGPLRALFHVDPARCRLTGKADRPLAYDKTKQAWRPEDFFRMASLASTDEEMYGLGLCGVSRALELAKLMAGVYEHSLEKLGSRAPKGLLLLKGISQEQWKEAMTSREAALEGLERDYYGAVAVLASMGMDDMDAKLVALSQLPDGFDLKTWTDLTMYGFALCFGYDPIEFWPVQAGSLGRGRETEIQHMKATGKGAASFMRSHQDQLQMRLPPSLLFEYEQRDQTGLLLEADVTQAWATVAKTLYEQGMGVLTRQQAMSVLAEQGVIPREWTTLEEDAEASDTGEMDLGAGEQEERQRLLETEPVQRAIARFPDEPIVRYEWPRGRMTMLWRRGDEAVARRRRAVSPPPLVQRQDDVLYQGDDFTVTENDVEQAIRAARERVGDEFGDLLEARPLTDEESETLDSMQGTAP